MIDIQFCEYCQALIEADPVPVAEENAPSGAGRTVYAHPEHAHLVKPDPLPAAMLARIRAHKAS